MDSIQFKRSNVAGKKPTTSALKVGELALNTADKQLFTKDADGNLVEFIDHQSVEQQFAMKKTQFEALRQANRDKYAGSGFVHWGKQLSSASTINEGMWELSSEPNKLVLGRTTNASGVSTSERPVVNVDGVLHSISNVASAHTGKADNYILFPDAPAGYETYDTSSGSYTNHLTAKSDKYKDADGNPTDAGGDVSEAVSRAFEGMIKYGDWRVDGDQGDWSNGLASMVVADGKLTFNNYHTTSDHYSKLDIIKSDTYVEGKEYILEVEAGDFVGNCQLHVEVAFGGNAPHQAVYLNANESKSLTFTLPSGDDQAGVISDRYVQLRLRDSKNSETGTIEVLSISMRPKNEQIIVSRQDLAYLETWFERVDKYDLVQPLGNSQFGSSSFNNKSLTDISTIAYTTKEVTTENEDGTTTTTEEDVTIGKGYAKFGAWQSDDDVTSAYGLQWSTLTDAEKLVYLQDPVHNLYWDEDEQALVQAKYRIKTVAGHGNDWYFSTVRHYQDENYVSFQYSSHNRPQFQGTSDTATKYGLNTKYVFRRGNVTNPTPQHFEKGLYVASSFDATDLPTDRSVNGEGYAIMIALVQRLNKGAYSPLNPMGCSKFRPISNGVTEWDSKEWYNEKVLNVKSLKQCFIEQTGAVSATESKKSPVSGYIGAVSGSGRPDSDPYEYYDAISEGQVLDLRLNANKQDINRLREDAMRKAVAGVVRGWESLPVSYIYTDSDNRTIGSCEWVYLPSDVDQTQFDIGSTVYLELADGTFTKRTITRTDTANRFFVSPPYDKIPNGSIVAHQYSPEKFNTLPMCDIIGDPANIKTVMDELGLDKLVGAWIPTIPLAESEGNTHIALTRKHSGTTNIYRYVTDDYGESWTTSNKTASNVTNDFYTNLTSQRFEFLHYPSLAKFTEAASNTAIVSEVGNVFAGCRFEIEQGARLQSSLSCGIAKSSTSNTAEWGYYNLNQMVIDGRSKELSIMNRPSIHTHLNLPTPTNNSPAVKALPTLVEKNGLWYLQLHGCELKHNGTSWGDDQTIPIVDNESTKTDDNGNTVKTFCHHTMQPLGIAYTD